MCVMEMLMRPAQRFADYENEIRVLEAKLRQEQRKNNAGIATISESGEKQDGQADTTPRPGISRFGSFMASRKAGATPPTTAPHATAAREKELEEKLVKEQTARIASEKKVKDAQAEVEELTATLFQQANEMVATERKQNAVLKEKMHELESQQVEAEGNPNLEKENTKLKEKIKVLEQRDTERKKRLERLEAANRRIERVKAMLQPP